MHLNKKTGYKPIVLSFPLIKYLAEKNTFWFLIIFITHIFFKSLYLDHCGFWYDEIFSLYFSQQDWGHLKHIAEWDVNPPLYYYFIFIWRNLFGIGVYAIRFSSVLFSSLAAGMLFIFCARFFNRTTAFISVLIFSASSNILFFAHEARSYSLILFLVLCSSWLFFDLLERKKTSTLVLLGITNFLLIYTHYFTVLVPFFQYLIAFLSRDKIIIRKMLYAAGIVLVLSIWRFTLKTILVIVNHEKDFWLKKAGFYELKWVFFDFFNNSYTFIFFAILFVTLLFYLFYRKTLPAQTKTENLKLLYIMCCGIVAVLVTFFVSQFTPVFLMRYLLYTSLFMYTTIGYLISIAEKPIRVTASALTIVVCLFSFAQLELKTEKSMNYRDAMPVIKKLQSPETLILSETKDIAPLFAYYYDREIFSDFKNMTARMNERNIYFVSTAEDLSSIEMDKYRKVVLTQSFEHINPENQKLIAYLTARYKLKAEVRYYNEAGIMVFSK